MKELNYSRLLQAVHINAKRNGISQAESCSLDKVMRFPHPSRELAFIEWALNSVMPTQPAQDAYGQKISKDQLSF